MSGQIKSGKKPLSSRPSAPIMSNDEFLGGHLALPAGLKEELEKQGLVGRWVNGKDLISNQGYHRRGWRPYKATKPAIIDNKDLAFGIDPSGLIRRGQDSVLAVKTIEEVERHKLTLKDRANKAQAAGQDRAHAAELRREARSLGVDTTIEDGYDE